MLPLLLWLLAARKKKLLRLRPHQLPHQHLLPHLRQPLTLLHQPPLHLLLPTLPLPLPPLLLLPALRRSNSSASRKSRLRAAFFMAH